MQLDLLGPVPTPAHAPRPAPRPAPGRTRAPVPVTRRMPPAPMPVGRPPSPDPIPPVPVEAPVPARVPQPRDPRLCIGKLPTSWASAFRPPPHHTCSCCGGSHFWTRKPNKDGWLCRTCYGPDPKDVVVEGVDTHA